MGVRDIGNPKYPWLIEELKLIKYSLNNNIPIIGVCLGAQLLAYESGGKVEKLYDQNTQNKITEIGWGKIYLKESIFNENFKDYFTGGLSVLHWHADRIKLPKGSHLIASSEICKEQIFKIGSNAYGLQCHLETNKNMISRWVEEDQEFITNALGAEGQNIILKNFKELGKLNEKLRISVLNKLFELIFSSKSIAI